MKIRGRIRERNTRGSAIAEFGPSLFVLLLLFFFPMLDLINLALTYSDCLYLNALLLRQAAMENAVVLDLSTSPPTVTVDQNTADIAKLNSDLAQVISEWSSGFGKFASTGSPPVVNSSVDLSEGFIPQSPPYPPPTEYIHINLTCACKPLVNIPFPYPVPGLNSNMIFQFNGRTILERVAPGNS